MKKKSVWIFGVGAVGLVIVGAVMMVNRERMGLPASAMEVLESADRFELITLKPGSQLSVAERARGEILAGNLVLGKAVVTDAAMRRRLIEAIDGSIRDAMLKGTMASRSCFNPRHAIRATKGGTMVTVVICFECLQYQFFVGENWGKIGALSGSGREAFDEAVVAMGLPVATRPAGENGAQ